MASCNCDHPPGGTVNCTGNQIPVCRVVNGVAHGYCLPPNDSATGLELTAWFVSHLLRRDVTTGEVLARRDLQAALSEGRLVNPDTHEVFTFRIPDSLHMPIPELVRARS